MFTDSISVKLISGRGGHGIVCWRREKYIPKGGPTGGNGGNGGAIKIEGDENIRSLDPFRSKRLIKAENGQSGGPNQRQGRRGKDLVLKVPCGTLIKDAKTQEVLFDITEHSQSIVLCTGGRGGRGNSTFKSSVKQAPNYCTPGTDGEEKELVLDLKMIADIGLVGFPNAGKSTLINYLTRSKAKCDAYPFTTLSPNIGYIETADFMRYSLADIPGIIEGAHNNKGLGLQFLKHIERTKALFYILDAASEDPLKDLMILREEIRSHQPDTLKKPAIVLLNKCDLEHSDETVTKIQSELKGVSVLKISAKEGDGMDELKKELFNLMAPFDDWK
ncbi:MAG: GTPase Obg [Chlamydiae bacterium]|nr:GTPase Obg [Chlamydiota bacterium]